MQKEEVFKAPCGSYRSQIMQHLIPEPFTRRINPFASWDFPTARSKLTAPSQARQRSARPLIQRCQPLARRRQSTLTRIQLEASLKVGPRRLEIVQA